MAQTLPSVVERLLWTILPGCIAPAQSIAVDENDPAQHQPIINPWLGHGSWVNTAQAAPSARRSARTGRSCAVSSRRLNQIAPLRTMGPDPAPVLNAIRIESIKWLTPSYSAKHQARSWPGSRCRIVQRPLSVAAGHPTYLGRAKRFAARGPPLQRLSAVAYYRQIGFQRF